MHSYIIQISVILYFSSAICNSSNILAIIPTGLFTHQAVWRPLWKELSSRGHQVTLVTTHPMKDSSLTNLTEIDISFVADMMEKYKFIEIVGNASNSIHQKSWELFDVMDIINREMYMSPQIQNLIHNRNQHFDLVITEVLYPVTVVFSWLFSCPWIGIASLEVGPHVHQAMGNPTHPILIPDYNSICADYDSLTFRERIEQLRIHFSNTVVMRTRFYPKLHSDLERYFGMEIPPLQEIHDNVSMIFTNTNPLVHTIRPLNPNTISIGSGIHIQPPKALPQELKKILDEADNGVIYFSLGSNIGSNLFNKKLRQVFIEVFRELPQTILWRFDMKDLENVPPNVKVQKWFPQQDILRHPNVRLFITQGGLQSLEESMTFGVPVLSMPFFGDQFFNTKKIVKKGAGLELSKDNIDKLTLKRTIHELISNTSYREKAGYLGQLLHDRPMKGIDQAVWWTEYVLRHKGAKHFRSRAIDIPFYQYFIFDIIMFVIVLFIIVIFIFYNIIKFLYRLIIYFIQNDFKSKAD